MDKNFQLSVLMFVFFGFTAGSYAFLTEGSVSQATYQANAAAVAANNTQGLSSAFFRNDATAQNILLGKPYYINGVYNQNGTLPTNSFSAKFLNGMRQVGYTGISSLVPATESAPLSWLHKFQRLNNLPQSDAIGSSELLKLDTLVVARESVDTQLAATLPISNIVSGIATEPSATHVAALLVTALKSLPPSLVKWNSDNISTYIRIQGPGGDAGGILTTAKGICFLDYYPSLDGQCNPTNTTMIPGLLRDDTSLVYNILHEYAHYLDGRVYSSGSNISLSSGAIDTAGFTAISYDTSVNCNPSSSWRFFKLRNPNNVANEFVTNYAARSFWLESDQSCRSSVEDFAESFAMYVMQGNTFRKLAETKPVIAQKYSWLKNYVFGGKEYSTGNAGNIPAVNQALSAPYMFILPSFIDWLTIDKNFVWNYQLSGNTVTPPTPTAPVISSLSPSRGPIGTPVTVTASGLDATSVVYFNGVAMPAMASAATGPRSSIGFTVPNVPPSFYSVQVSNAGGKSTSSQFMVFQPTLVACNLDVDGNGQKLYPSDGILIGRYMQGIRGSDLLLGVTLGRGATRTTAAAIDAFIAGHNYDVDGNGIQDYYTDGQLIKRYLLKDLIPFTTSGILFGTSATRTTTSQILGWLNSCAPSSVTSASLWVATDPSSPSYQIAAGGSRGVTLGAYRLRATGDSIQLQKIGLRLTSGHAQDLTQVYLYQGATLVGMATFLGGNTTATSTLVTPVTLVKDVDRVLIVKGDLAGIGLGQSGVSGDLIKVDYNSAQGVGLSSGMAIYGFGSTYVAGIRLFKSYPTLALDTLASTGVADGRLVRFKVTANSASSVGLGRFTFNIMNSSGMTITNVGLFGYTDSSYSSAISGQETSGQISNSVGTIVSGTNHVFVPGSSQVTIPPGAARYFELRGSVAGVASGSAVVTKLLGDPVSPFPIFWSAFGLGSNFVWSPNSTTTTSFTDFDWTNGYGLAGLPSGGIIQTRSN